MTDLAAIDEAYGRVVDWLREASPASPLPEVNWTYAGDAHVQAVVREPVIVMGFNPGAGRGGKADRMSRSERAWKTRCERLTAGFCDRFVLSELIPLSSLDQRALRAESIDLDRAFEVGADLNRAIVSYHKPRLIFQTGLGYRETIAELYGLTAVCENTRPEHPKEVLLRHSRTEDGTPWIAFRHFAAPGFSNRDRDAIREYVSAVS